VTSDPKVATIQRRLNALGCGGACTPLDVDGVVGPKTTAAIRMFGQANSFSSDGTLTDSIAALVNSRGAKPCLDMAKIVIGACPPPAGSKPVTAEPTGTSKFTLPSLSSPWVIGGIALGALGIAYLLTRPNRGPRLGGARRRRH
jgi:peptidoglycan hydrolase-like protein with peptidoglycan-binding domain